MYDILCKEYDLNSYSSCKKIYILYMIEIKYNLHTNTLTIKSIMFKNVVSPESTFNPSNLTKLMRFIYIYEHERKYFMVKTYYH